MRQPAFKSRGFYLHAAWKFNYPFAVREWSRADYRKMFNFLRLLDINKVMLWPMLEIMTPPLTASEVKWIKNMRGIAEDAQNSGLECWGVLSPNLCTKKEIKKVSVKDRHYYPYKKIYRLDDEIQYKKYISILETWLKILNNYDGYVFIDGDPGGYAGAKPEDYVHLFHSLRKIINRYGEKAGVQKIIPWLWCGWGADGVWKEDFAYLTKNVLREWKRNPPPGPWELLPGRSHSDKSFLEEGGSANGRINFELVEETGFIGKSTLMLYEIIEFEPTPPALVVQFDLIRKVIKRELEYAGEVRGVMGNAQQPLMSLHNLYLFARGTKNPEYLEKSDEEILKDYSEFLGGDPDLLVPAFRCLELPLEDIPVDLPEKIRESSLRAEVALDIPGGADTYLGIIADFVDARISSLKCFTGSPSSNADNVMRIAKGFMVLRKWWEKHHYIYSGEQGTDFSSKFTHEKLRKPFSDWMKKYGSKEAVEKAAEMVVSSGLDSKENIVSFMMSV